MGCKVIDFEAMRSMQQSCLTAGRKFSKATCGICPSSTVPMPCLDFVMCRLPGHVGNVADALAAFAAAVSDKSFSAAAPGPCVGLQQSVMGLGAGKVPHTPGHRQAPLSVAVPTVQLQPFAAGKGVLALGGSMRHLHMVQVPALLAPNHIAPHRDRQQVAQLLIMNHDHVLCPSASPAELLNAATMIVHRVLMTLYCLTSTFLDVQHAQQLGAAALLSCQPYVG